MMTTNRPRILDVGQCDYDHGNIHHMLSKEFGADVERAATGEEAFRAVCAERYDLVLVNRVLDSDGASGLDFIHRLKSNDKTRTTPVMLVSNYADAQDVAVDSGAAKGFGKSMLTDPETRDRLASLFEHQKPQ